MMTFGPRIKTLREDREPPLSQARRAESLGSSQRKISHLERDEAEPNLEDLRRLCLYYHVSADYLLGLPSDLPYPKP